MAAPECIVIDKAGDITLLCGTYTKGITLASGRLIAGSPVFRKMLTENQIMARELRKASSTTPYRLYLQFDDHQSMLYICLNLYQPVLPIMPPAEPADWNARMTKEMRKFARLYAHCVKYQTLEWCLPMLLKFSKAIWRVCDFESLPGHLTTRDFTQVDIARMITYCCAIAYCANDASTLFAASIRLSLRLNLRLLQDLFVMLAQDQHFVFMQTPPYFQFFILRLLFRNREILNRAISHVASAMYLWSRRDPIAPDSGRPPTWRDYHLDAYASRRHEFAALPDQPHVFDGFMAALTVEGIGPFGSTAACIQQELEHVRSLPITLAMRAHENRVGPCRACAVDWMRVMDEILDLESQWHGLCLQCLQTSRNECEECKKEPEDWE